MAAEPASSSIPDPVRAEASTPPSIPDHELLRCIGRGSYGEVWLARHGAGDFRAVKVVYRKTFEHDRPFERELSGIQKFEPISRSHPSQVGILQVGRNQDAGYFYYVMELADEAGARGPDPKGSCPGPGAGPEAPGLGAADTPSGTFDPATYVPRTLKSELLRRGRLPFGECLEIGLALATAVDHLHQHGLIHRDIKPSNVIFVNGVPKLADIGLVTDVGATISFVGTEGFLPPEGPGTPQADLFSLGKVLYELSTGRDRMDFPELPTFADETTDGQQLLELNLILLKCCQNDVRKRYQSARNLFSDLLLLQAGKSLRRARAREKRLAAARSVAIAVTLCLAGIAIASHLLQQQRLERLQQEKTKLTQAAERDAADNRRVQDLFAEQVRHLADLYWDKGDSLVGEGDLFGALLWFERALRLEPRDTDQRHTQKIEAVRQRCPRILLFLTQSGPIRSAALSADGRRLVTAGDNQTAQVWDARSGEELGRPLKHSARVQHAELSADGERVLTLTEDGLAQIWTALTGEPIRVQLDRSGLLQMATFSPSGRQVLTVTAGPEAQIRETSSARVRFELKHQGKILAATYSPDGRLVAVASAEPAVAIWNAETGEPVGPGLRPTEAITQVAFSPDSRRLVTVSGPRAQVWEARSGERASWFLQHDGPVRDASFSPDARRLVTAGDDHSARVWDAITGQLLSPALRHSAPVERARFSPDGCFLATISGNRGLIWDALSFGPPRLAIVHNGVLGDARFSFSGHCLLTAGEDGTARGVALGLGALAGSPSLPTGGEDLTPWAQALSGREISREEKLAPLPAEALRDRWRHLRTNYPSAFEPADLGNWHERSAEACEQVQHWFGAAFHWKRAAALHPNQPTLRERFEHATSELAQQDVRASRPPELPARIPPRSPDTSPRLIDLSEFYNAALTDTWFPTNVVATGNDLSALRRGVQKFGGVEFDVRGLVQLSGGALENLGGRFPREVRGIRVHRKCRRLHILHDAAWGAPTGTPIGSYAVGYTNGESLEIKIVFGQNVREWWFASSPAQMVTGAAVAWEGSNAASRAMGMKVRLYQMTWINPWPDIEVATIDFRSNMENPAPFLVALTVE